MEEFERGRGGTHGHLRLLVQPQRLRRVTAYHQPRLGGQTLG